MSIEIPCPQPLCLGFFWMEWPTYQNLGRCIQPAGRADNDSTDAEEKESFCCVGIFCQASQQKSTLFRNACISKAFLMYQS